MPFCKKKNQMNSENNPMYTGENSSVKGEENLDNPQTDGKKFFAYFRATCSNERLSETELFFIVHFFATMS